MLLKKQVIILQVKDLMNKKDTASKKNLKSLKNKAWKLFSQIVRQRGADKKGFNVCITCGVKKHWKKLQAGHFLDGRSNAVLFDMNGVWPQCFRCNFKSWGCLAGNKVVYTLWMIDKFGIEFVKRSIEISKTKIVYSHEDYRDLI